MKLASVYFIAAIFFPSSVYAGICSTELSRTEHPDSLIRLLELSYSTEWQARYFDGCGFDVVDYPNGIFQFHFYSIVATSRCQDPSRYSFIKHPNQDWYSMCTTQIKVNR